jgi:hypothetical protein
MMMRFYGLDDAVNNGEMKPVKKMGIKWGKRKGQLM